MGADVLEAFTRQYIEAQRVPQVVFAWQGGEPTLMGLEFFERALHFQRKYARPGMKISNTLQTNGVMLDADWCKFFGDNRFLIGLSLDGPRQLHDGYRKDKGGHPTFGRVLHGLQLLQAHNVQVNTLTTVHAINVSHPLDVYHFLRDEAKSGFIQFIPIVERDNQTGYQQGSRLTKRSVGSRQYGEFLTAIFDEWVRRDVDRVYVQIFDVTLGTWMGRPGGLCIFAPTCGTGLALEHNGDVYACDHYVEPKFMLGNLMETDLPALAASPQQAQFGRNKMAALPRYCRECEVRFACHGGCPKNRILRTPAGEPGLNYLCAGYKHFFRHVNTPMQMMSALIRQGRHPAEVMNLLNG